MIKKGQKRLPKVKYSVLLFTLGNAADSWSFLKYLTLSYTLVTSIAQTTQDHHLPELREYLS